MRIASHVVEISPSKLPLFSVVLRSLELRYLQSPTWNKIYKVKNATCRFMYNIKKTFAIILIVTMISAALPLIAQSDVVQVSYTIQIYQNARPDSPGKAKPTPVSPDYKLIFNRGTTDIPLTLTVYTQNPEGISSTQFLLAISNAASEWDDETSASLIGDINVVTFGSTVVAPNDINAIFFADLGPNVIAQASIWYSRATKEILECDICFNTDFAWGTNGEATVMDLQNIATHELGHFFNLADIYDESKDDLTMYGYSWEGDIQKRDLAEGDILGIQKVFGV